jgi:hypothetical protein
MRFRPDGSLDESLTLRSVEDASAGPNLLSVIAEARDQALQALARSVRLFSDGETARAKRF